MQLRGLRLELGEVEGVLCGCALVRRAAATVDGHALLAAIEPADADLAAAAAADGDDGGDDAAAERRDELAAAAVALVAAHVRRWLPAAACPRRIALVAALPLTPTGKLDRATLLETLRRGEGSGDDGAAASDAPADALERKVAATWAEVLGVPLRAVTRRADFVRQGGDSIKALQLARTLSVQLVHAHEKGPPKGGPDPGGPPESAALPKMPQNNAASRAVAHAAAAGAEAADYGRIRGVFSPIEVLRRPLLYRYAAFLREAGAAVAEEEADGGDDDAAAADVAGGGGASSSVAELQLLQSEVGSGEGSEARLLLLALALGARHGSGAVVEAALALGADPAPRPARLLARAGGGVANSSASPPSTRPHAPATRPSSRGCSRARAAHPPLVRRRAAAPSRRRAAGGARRARRPPRRRRAPRDARRPPPDGPALRRARRQRRRHRPAARRRGGDPPGRERSAGGCREPFIELRDRWHRTALHWAVVNGEAAAAAALVAAGAGGEWRANVGRQASEGDLAPARGANPLGGAAAARRRARPRPHPRRRARRPAEGRPVRPDRARRLRRRRARRRR